MCWENLLPSARLAIGDVTEINWQGEDLLLFRTASGDCKAISAYCPHMGNYIPNGLAPEQALSALLEGEELRCPFHDWRFNGEGQCTHIPQGQRVPAAVSEGKAVTRSWRVREQGQSIQIAAR